MLGVGIQLLYNIGTQFAVYCLALFVKNMPSYMTYVTFHNGYRSQKGMKNAGKRLKSGALNPIIEFKD